MDALNKELKVFILDFLFFRFLFWFLIIWFFWILYFFLSVFVFYLIYTWAILDFTWWILESYFLLAWYLNSSWLILQWNLVISDHQGSWNNFASSFCYYIITSKSNTDEKRKSAACSVQRWEEWANMCALNDGLNSTKLNNTCKIIPA